MIGGDARPTASTGYDDHRRRQRLIGLPPSISPYCPSEGPLFGQYLTLRASNPLHVDLFFRIVAPHGFLERQEWRQDRSISLDVAI